MIASQIYVFIFILSCLVFSNTEINKIVISGGQAVQMAKAGLKAIYLSGWQVSADYNLAAQTYPDLGLYPVNSAPRLVEAINNAFIRADQIAHMEGTESHIDYFLPIVADCEAGFGGPLNAFEITKSMVMARFLLYLRFIPRCNWSEMSAVSIS